MNVVVLRWPEEQDEAARLASLRVPRLLLVANGADPPEGGDSLQDWVRLPGDERDVRARISGLRQRADADAEPPIVDGHGRLSRRGAWVQLSPIEERLARALIDAFDKVVSEAVLVTAGWPRRPGSSNALRVHLHRLRRRLGPLALEIRVVRSQGWVLQAARAPAGATS